SDTACRLPFWR
ncbi:host specificity protein J, partial [Escherichia coli TW00353]